MAVPQEECFPRGQSTTKKPALRKIKTSLFNTGLPDLSKKKVKKFKVREKNIKDKRKKLKKKREKKETTKIRPLTYQSLEDGMLVLGRVREVNALHLFVCLPGRLSVKVSAAAVSEPYTDLLNQMLGASGTSTEQECPSLEELFCEGQPVVCRVSGAAREGQVMGASASLEPAQVNGALRHDTVRAGQSLVAAVSAQQDHGYSMHTGVPGLTAFLANAQATAYSQRNKQGAPLVVGELLICLVVKSKTGRDCSQVELTPFPCRKSQQGTDLPSNLLPGTPVRCLVKQKVPGGLVVSVGSIRGLIEAAQFRDCWFDTKQFKPDTQLNATVLYVSEHDEDGNPKTVHLTLKDIHRQNIIKIPLGQIINAEVTSANYRAIYLCLGDKMDNSLGNKGIVSKHRVDDPVKMTNLRKYYPKGTRLTTRVLAYDYLEEVYNCTLEKSKLCEQYVRVDEVNVGDRLIASVSDVQQWMVLLAVGSVKMAVFKEHSADDPYDDLLAHFNKGDIVRARVLRASGPKRLVATLRPTLLRSPALLSYAQARIGDVYWGTVRHVRDFSLLVGFYADVTGILNLDKPQTFRTNQLVRCRIAYVNPSDRRLTLSLEPPENESPQGLEVGELCELEVTGETPEHFTVVPFDHDGNGNDGILPKSHLPDQVSYSIGQSLKGWLYFKAGSVYHFSNNPTIQNFFTNVDTLEPSELITCCVGRVEADSKWVDVYSSHPSYPVIRCPRKYIPVSGNLRTHEIIQLPQKIITKYKSLNDGSTEVQQETGETLQELKQARKQKRKNSKESISEPLPVNRAVNFECEEEKEIHGNNSSESEDIETSVAIEQFKKKYEKELQQILGFAAPTILGAENDSDSREGSKDEDWPQYQKRDPIDLEIELEIGLVVPKKHANVQSKVGQEKKSRHNDDIAKVSVSLSKQKERGKLLRVSPKKPHFSNICKHDESLSKDSHRKEVPVKKRKLS